MSGFELMLHIGGGVALLLWATRMVRTGVERVFGVGLRRALRRATGRRGRAFCTGIGVAAALQSATATALLVTAFAAGGLLKTVPGLAVMLGADVGSTLVVQALSFDLGWLSPVLLLVGTLLFLGSTRRRLRQYGRILIGLGLLLLALAYIVDAATPLRDSAALATVIAALGDDPLLALTVGAALTWLAHSSVAIILLILSLAVAGVVPVLLALVLVLGANIGASLAPLALAPRDAPVARRIPLGNLLFRSVGALAALALLYGWPHLTPWLGDTPARQIANFHTAFNMALALLCLPLTGVMAWLTERLLPAAPSGDEPPEISHLDPTVLDRPALALACATREVLRMADSVEIMLRQALSMFEAGDRALIERIGKLDDRVDALHTAIKLYLVQVSCRSLAEADSRRCLEITAFAIRLEHIGDIIDKNLGGRARTLLDHRLTFSPQGLSELRAMHQRVVENMTLALSVFISADVDSARRLFAEKDHFRALERQSSERHLGRLRSGESASIETSAIHLDILRDLKQINSHLATVTYSILDSVGELHASRLKHPPGLYLAGGEGESRAQ